jgi:hypothetical protein
MTDPILTLERGKNTPFWRTTEQKKEILKDLAREALDEVQEETNIPVTEAVIETKWHNSSLEPHIEYGEVKVYDKADVHGALI